ncbi:4094_t:CDS:2 [Cetraspora pellucida]|uniref:4094_t:CDS:1 n=1 Tax=Cetraspora pellucida TaxID=1433469 RepID=A0ACA9MVS6_9GLOM|nr:4094_t:CDS:2 [Cetraspora pellucida]
MYPVNQPVTPAQPLNASIKQVMVLLREVAMAQTGHPYAMLVNNRGNSKDSSNDSANTKQIQTFKLRSASLKGESVQPTTNPFIAKIKEAYMAKKKCVDEESAEVKPSPGNSRSDGDIQASKQISNQKSEQGNSKKVMKKKVTKPVEPPVMAKI